MNVRVIAVLAVLATLAFAGGCSRRGERAESHKAVGSHTESDQTATSDAARGRGVSSSDTGAASEQQAPRIELGDVTYEWRTAPEKGLSVTVDLLNPVKSYERARGYIFLIASSSSDPSAKGIYPWNAVLDGERPRDFKAGTHLLYRKDDQVRAFIPYKRSGGHYDTLTLLIYNEEGESLMSQTYELEVTGEPTGPKKSTPPLVL
jgi:hypothetical protein